jgi:hypothetical protein
VKALDRKILRYVTTMQSKPGEMDNPMSREEAEELFLNKGKLDFITPIPKSILE